MPPGKYESQRTWLKKQEEAFVNSTEEAEQGSRSQSPMSMARAAIEEKRSQELARVSKQDEEADNSGGLGNNWGNHRRRRSTIVAVDVILHSPHDSAISSMGRGETRTFGKSSKYDVEVWCLL